MTTVGHGDPLDWSIEREGDAIAITVGDGDQPRFRLTPRVAAEIATLCSWCAMDFMDQPDVRKRLSEMHSVLHARLELLRQTEVALARLRRADRETDG